eukprot:3040376-Amphidinium_carterae.1
MVAYFCGRPFASIFVCWRTLRLPHQTEPQEQVRTNTNTDPKPVSILNLIATGCNVQSKSGGSRDVQPHAV